MELKERRLSYSIAFKVEVVNYTEKYGNREAERPTSDREDEWREQRKYLIKTDKSKK
jgi:hypothetical protein